MAETDKKIEAMEQEVSEASANPQADAPKKNAVAAEPTHLKNDAEDFDDGKIINMLLTIIKKTPNSSIGFGRLLQNK